MRRAGIALIALLLLAAYGPSTPSAMSHSQTATATAPVPLCQAVATVNQSLTSLSTINANTTVSEALMRQGTVTHALNKLVILKPGPTGPILIEVQAANNQLAATLRSYPDNPTMGQTSIDLHGLKNQVTVWQGQMRQLASALKCTS